MFSRDIKIHFGDKPHLIFDLETGDYRDSKGRVSIGNHVWVGERSYLTKNAGVGNECVVAACSVLTKKFNNTHALIGGNPAKLLRENIAWIRNRTMIKSDSNYARSLSLHEQFVENADSPVLDP